MLQTIELQAPQKVAPEKQRKYLRPLDEGPPPSVEAWVDALQMAEIMAMRRPFHGLSKKGASKVHVAFLKDNITELLDERVGLDTRWDVIRWILSDDEGAFTFVTCVKEQEADPEEFRGMLKDLVWRWLKAQGYNPRNRVRQDWADILQGLVYLQNREYYNRKGQHSLVFC
jgi:hypothetical protein